MATAAFILLAAAAAEHIVHLVIRKDRRFLISPWLFLAAGLLLIGEITARSLRIRFIALTGIFESLVFFAAVISFLLFWYSRQRRYEVIPLARFGTALLAIILLAVASSPLIPGDAKPPIPALQSAWLVLHVSFAFIGEGFFAAAFVFAILYLSSKSDDRKRSLDRLTYTCVGIGYPFYTAGALIFGAIWAQKAWGSYWSWDPKETWALVTWLVFTAYLHTRLIMKKKSALPAIMVIVGFVLTIFTFLGVNYLIAGLHSYV